jgi:hypothetical protein
LANKEHRNAREEVWKEAQLTLYGESIQARKQAEEAMNKALLPGPM